MTKPGRRTISKSRISFGLDYETTHSIASLYDYMEMLYSSIHIDWDKMLV